MKKCSKCGCLNLDEAIFCGDCGARLETISKNSKKCPKCGHLNRDETFYCSSCGASLNSNTNKINSNTNKINSNTNNNSNSTINNSNSTNSNSNQNSPNSSSNESGANQKEGPDKLKICCCYVPVILLIISIIFGSLIAAFPENFPTYQEGDFEYLDFNNDDKLSFEEARQYDPYMEDREIRSYFLEADKNDNGFLIGQEFDNFRDDVRFSDSSIYKDSESNSESSSSSTSSSHGHDYSSGNNKYSNNLNDQEFDREDGYVLTCPYCGSEALYETGGHYKCGECGRSIYNPDDLELGYWDGYME